MGSSEYQLKPLEGIPKPHKPLLVTAILDRLKPCYHEMSSLLALL